MKLEQATSQNTKVGDKCYIEVEVLDIEKVEYDYPMRTNFGIFSKKGMANKDNPNSPQLYHIRQEEIPTLEEGVEMEVSNNGNDWDVKIIIAKYKDSYVTSNGWFYIYARPIQLTLEQKYENLLKENEELKQKLSKM